MLFSLLLGCCPLESARAPRCAVRHYTASAQAPLWLLGMTGAVASGRGGPGEQDDPVVVGVQDVTGVERDTAEGDRHVDRPGACLLAPARVRAQCLDPEVEPGQRRAVADRAAHAQPGPALADRPAPHPAA